MLTYLFYRLNMCVILFLVVLKSRQVILLLMLLLNLLVILFVFLNSLVHLCLLKASYSPSYCIVKRCDFHLVNKVIIKTRCSVSVCHKVHKSVLVSVSINIFHASPHCVVNVIIAPTYQHYNLTNNVNKSVFSASTVSFLPALTLSINPVMPLHFRNVLISVNTICHVCKVSLYIPPSINTIKTLVDYVSHNERHVQCSKCISFKSSVSYF